MICCCHDTDLDKLEIQYMAEFNSIVPNGYNLREGGNSGRHNEETKKKISNALKGRTDIIRNHNHCREASKKKVDQYDLDNNFIKSYDSITDASKATCACLSKIGSVCSGKGKTAGGFIWRYNKSI